MSDEVVVWNADARYRPELEVEIEVIGAPTPTPAKGLALGTPPVGMTALLKDAEIPFANLDDLQDDWFCDVDAYVADDGSVVLS